MTDAAPSPGWYPDPDDATRIRYWDGGEWTERTAERTASGPQPPRGSPPPPPPPPPPERAEPSATATKSSTRRRILPITLAGAALIVVLGVAAYLVLAGSDDASAEVILQSTADDGPDPFTDSVANMKVDELTSNGTDIAGDPVEGVSGGDRSVEGIDGSAPGLYGGSEQEQVCDPDAMVAFLEDNPDKAAAWASAQGIAVKDISDFVATLTPVILREDTRVTNNGFADGEATPFQAVLQAGTAVLVDDRGVPRVRCACGNPLAEADPIDSSPEYSGDQWESFDADRLVAVTPSKKQVQSFELVDVETGERFEQAAGSGGDVRDLVFDIGGVGNLLIGMTEKEAEQATGLDVVFGEPYGGSPTCVSITVPELGDTFSGLSEDGETIGELTTRDPKASTTEGIKVGDTLEDVESAYPGQVRVDAGVAAAGYEQIYVEPDGPNGDALRFFTEPPGRITTIGTGRAAEIHFVEGCL